MKRTRRPLIPKPSQAELQRKARQDLARDMTGYAALGYQVAMLLRARQHD